MEMPKPGAEHEKLKALVGNWKAQETMAPSPWDPKGGEAEASSVAKLGLDGMFVIAEYEQQRGGHVTYRGHGVFGWDAGQKSYTMYWFDSMGSDPGGPARGSWEGDTLTFQMQSKMGHSRYTYRFRSADEYAFEIHMSRDGETWNRWIDSVYRRV
jgi:hypothetical protein